MYADAKRLGCKILRTYRRQLVLAVLCILALSPLIFFRPDVQKGRKIAVGSQDYIREISNEYMNRLRSINSTDTEWLKSLKSYFEEGILKPKVFSHPEETTSRPRTVIPREKVTQQKLPNCSRIFARDYHELAYAVDYQKKYVLEDISIETLNQYTASCDSFIKVRGYPMVPQTKIEAEFGIAYVITAYTDIGHLERLLRAIYAPQNLVCIHIDKKSSDKYFKAVEQLAGCFPNVMMSSTRFDVQWGRWSQVEANLACMEQLTQSKYWKKWKYLINLTGHEYPMKTNYQVVRILQAYKGANDLGGSKEEGRKFLYRLTGSKKLPLNMEYVKGEIHGLFSKNFVKYLFTDFRARALIEYMRDNAFLNPDESLFVTLNYNVDSGAPGGFQGPDRVAHSHWYYMWPVRYKHWSAFNSPAIFPYSIYGCRGEYEHGMCQFGIEDIGYIREFARKGPFLFLNKLRGNPWLVPYCLEQDMLERMTSVPADPDLGFFYSMEHSRYSRHNGLDELYS